MNLNFLCCIGAEQKHDQSGLLKMNQIYFYRAYADETMSEILEDNFFNHSESHLKENDIVLAYSPNEQDLPKTCWLRIVIPHAGLVKTEQVDNSYLLEVLRNDLGDLGDQVAEIEAKIPGSASVINQLATKNDITNKITNCITEIPQDIKLELADGVMVLKVGSKVYVPNGFESDGTTPKFDEVTISTDKQNTTSTSTSGTGVVFYNTISNTLFFKWDNQVSSGTSDITNYIVYRTDLNKISDGGAYGRSFPLGIITVTSGTITSIDQVFNMFGYIGSTVFALPGVKGLTPDGRNEEGTLKNVYWTTSSIILRTYSTAYNGEYDIFLNGGAFGALKNTYIYDEESNYNMDSNNRYNSTYIGKASITSGVISNFATKNAFHAVDYSDTEYIAHQAMPSDRYIDLTLGASGATYTAPADGYLTINKSATATGQYINFINGSNGMNCNSIAPSALPLRLCMSASKGDVITINYNATGNTTLFRFIYANGAK